MDIIVKVVQFILCFSLLVFVHEMGHFLFAKLFKIRVEKFYLFFNPGFSLFKFTFKGTEYGMGWIPFGGYVSISGMIDETKGASELASEPQPYEFRSKPAWQRLLVMVGGVMMNIITAIVIFTFMSYTHGTSYIKSSDVVDGYAFSQTAKDLGFKDGDNFISVNGESFDNYKKYREAIIINDSPWIDVDRGGETVRIQLSNEDVPALIEDQIIYELRLPFGIDSVIIDGGMHKAGIMVGDSIISINNQKIKYFDQLQLMGEQNKDKEVIIVAHIKATGAVDTLTIKLSEEGKFGFAPFIKPITNYYKITEISYSFLESIPEGFRRVGSMVVSYIKQLKMIFNPETEAYKSVGSVLTMGNLFPPVWDWLFFWNITALFSVILAVMNILPIPALDGGHVVFLLYEVITRRKPSDKFMERMQTIGFFIILGIMVLALWNDITKFLF